MGGRGASSASSKGIASFANAKTAAKDPGSRTQSGHLSGDEIPDTPEKTAAYLGVSVEEAKEMHGAVSDYTGSMYSAIRKAQRDPNYDNEPARRKGELVESYIEHAPKWAGGTTYRGVVLDTSKVDEMRPGRPVDPNYGGSASWSTKENTARDFASTGSEFPGRSKVVFVCETQRMGTSVQHISSYGSSEAEVLVSKKASYTVEKVVKSKGNGYNYVYVKEE